MNKSQMKRQHIEQANISLQKRLEETSKGNSSKESLEKKAIKKEILTDKLINQLKNGK